MKLGMDSARTEATWLTVGFVVLAMAWDAAGLDLPLARLAGSAAGFPWRDHWLLAAVLHDGARRLSWLLALALCLSVWWPLGVLKQLPQGRRLQLAITTLLAALVVSMLKVGSHTSCPWELNEFGSVARYATHWTLRRDGGTGRCFPAGHAASGFSFVAAYFAFRPFDRAAARHWLAAAVGAGLVLGLAQQWRGAHFMSHTLWTAAICWIVAIAIDAGWPRGAKAARA
ncbi:phosphatase PAP2 family protein [Ramlibacter sp. PS3R-8]|uniref:phosphatase PAP2 family protein n=1 Tax=Ramlibacter sp. PS3R-8 TaxID=3133437 RepID=UPI0030AD1C31